MMKNKNIQKEFEHLTQKDYWVRKKKREEKKLKILNILKSIKGCAIGYKEIRDTEESIWRDISKNIFYSFIIATILLLFDRFLIKLYIIPQLIKAVPFIKILGLNLDYQTAILCMLVQVSALFIGLYFAAKGNVLGAVYSRAAENVRTIITKEKPGEAYFKKLHDLAATSFFFLIAGLFGLKLGLLSLVYITFLGLFGIYGFIKLAQIVYSYLNPTKIVTYPIHGFIKNLENIMPGKKGWEDENVQAYYQQMAEEDLNTIDNIVKLVINEREFDLNGIMFMFNMIDNLLVYYEFHKPKIPANSLWFKKTYEHKNWITAQESEVSIAIETGTPISPSGVNDLFWVENKIVEIFENIIRKTLVLRKYRNAIEILNNFQQAIINLSSYYCVDESILIIEKIYPLIFNQNFLKESDSEKDKEQNNKLAILDVFGLCFINMEVGIFQRLSSVSPKNISNDLKNINWVKRETIYKDVKTREFIEQLEIIRKGIGFENSVEQRTISPVWYQEMIATFGYLRFIERVLPLVFSLFEKIWLKYKAGEGTEIGVFYEAQHLQRGIEACSKLKILLDDFKGCFERLKPLVRIEDIPLPQIEWEKLNRKVLDYRKNIIIKINGLIIDLSKRPREKEKPDYFGFAYSLIAEECFNSMVNKDLGLFNTLFENFFKASFIAYFRLEEEFKKFSDDARIKYSSDPLFDLVDISGYAIIFTELGFGNFWSSVHQLWEGFLEKENKGNLIGYLAILIDYSINHFGLTPRNIIRTGWRISFEQVLRDNNLLNNQMYFRYIKPDEIPPKHESPIIRSLISGEYVLNDARDVFFADYLMNHKKANGIDFSYGLISFKESLDREKTIAEGDNDARE